MYIDYDIVTSNNLQSLIDMVNLHIENGWQPVGGVRVIYNSATHLNTFYQTIGRVFINDLTYVAPASSE